MLQRADDVIAIGEPPIPLVPPHGRQPHLADEVGVFAKGLFDTSPARVAGDVEHGGEQLVGAARPRFQRRHLIQSAHQFGVERGRQTDRLGEVGRLAGH